MDNSITIFEHPQFGQIRVVGEWFVARDLCIALEHTDTSVACSRLDDDEKLLQTMFLAGQNRQVITVNESGLYHLIMTARTASAREFRRWVTSEVLPSIRQHGAYMTPATIESILDNPDTIIQLATRLKAHRAEIAVQQAYIEILEPKADFYDAVAGSKDAISIGDMTKVLGIKGIGQNTLFKLLREKHILNGENIPFQEYIDRNYFRIVEQKYTARGEVRIYLKTLVYQKGLDYIRKVVTSA